jgi:hypothetical protein
MKNEKDIIASLVKPSKCLAESIGSCSGCFVAQAVLDLVRWGPMEEIAAINIVEEMELCPSGLKPKMISNQWACFSMGQPREENLKR